MRRVASFVAGQGPPCLLRRWASGAAMVRAGRGFVCGGPGPALRVAYGEPRLRGHCHHSFGAVAPSYVIAVAPVTAPMRAVLCT